MSQKDLEAELLKALMVTYATATIIASGVGPKPLTDEELAAQVKAVKEALSQ